MSPSARGMAVAASSALLLLGCGSGETYIGSISVEMTFEPAGEAGSVQAEGRPEQSGSDAGATPDTEAPRATPALGRAEASARSEIRQAEPDLRGYRVRNGVVELSFDDLDLKMLLDLDPVPVDVVDDLPESITSLEGRRVRIRGFMYPAYEEPLRAFVLARDNEICCFGRDPKIYDLVPTLLAEGTTTRYIEGRPFDVVGTFRVKPKVEDGRWYRLYQLEDARIDD